MIKAYKNYIVIIKFLTNTFITKVAFNCIILYNKLFILK